MPRFNPHDGNEIMFFDLTHGLTSDFTLYRHLLGTSAMDEILSGSNLVNTAYSWGENGNILLTMYGQDNSRNIFMCSEEGDGLHQVTFTDWNFVPVWSPSAQAYVYQHQSVAPYSQIIVDQQSGDPDTLSSPYGFFYSAFCWYDGTKAVDVDDTGVRTWDMLTGAVSNASTYPSELNGVGYPSGIAVLSDHRTAVWSHILGLYRTDLLTGATTRLFHTCNSQYFVGLDYSPQTNKLLTTRITRTPMNEHDLLIETDIVLMNPDGTDQQVLALPFPE